MNRSVSILLTLAATCVLLTTGCFADEKATQSEKPQNEKAGKPKPQANRLAKETSPYLLQHAYNPVDWYPWSDEAFAKAKAEGKLIFLSVGYSSCHWCHVMEHESFEDDEIAAFLNANFVCIKVDREERPDVDAIYMQSVQMLTGRGGWPMSVFMTADAKPFYGGSYFPARDGDREGAPGFLTLIKAIQEAWKKDDKQILASADQVTAALEKQMDLTAVLPEAEPSPAIVARVQRDLLQQFDPQFGGFGFAENNPNQPKFPEPSNAWFLLHRAGDSRLETADRDNARRMLEHTLDMMAAGGIHDHLGGGFHRYSVDRFWKIPHFEKMLYDNGQLATVYAEAYALTGNEAYRWVVEDLLKWVARDMTSPEGAFYSAMDADSEGEEGAFYRWTPEQIKSQVSESDFALLASTYGLDKAANFEEHYHVLQLASPIASVASTQKIPAAELVNKLSPLRVQLRKLREKRESPFKDTKVLTSWNGLMIRGYADAGRILKKDEYTQAAQRAGEFVLKNLRRPNGTLLRTYGSGKAKLNAYLDDYAFLVSGLLGLHKATGQSRWLDLAKEITDKQIELFWDDKKGGFFFTSGNHESLIARAKDPVDSAIPSGNSVAAENLLILSESLEQDAAKYRDYAKRTVTILAGLLNRSPTSAPRAAVVMSKLEKTVSP